ncbi:unnamed protein product [Brassica oleracea]
MLMESSMLILRSQAVPLITQPQYVRVTGPVVEKMRSFPLIFTLCGSTLRAPQ